MAQVKDNANPTIHSVVISRRKERKELIDFQRWHEGGGLVLQALQLNSKTKRRPINPTHTEADLTVTDNTDNTDMEMNHIKLLKNAGLRVPSSSSSSLSSVHESYSTTTLIPFFIPSVQHRMQQQRHFQQPATNNNHDDDNDDHHNCIGHNAVERELVDEDEIFDTIRNIQDPEHPLTLEQLNVVNRNHITVQDSGCNTKPSTIHVRFT